MLQAPAEKACKLWADSCKIAFQQDMKRFNCFDPRFSCCAIASSVDVSREPSMKPQLISCRISLKQLASLILSLTACVALLTASAQAQQATALITGTVKDPSGAVVTGAKVTLKN